MEQRCSGHLWISRLPVPEIFLAATAYRARRARVMGWKRPTRMKMAVYLFHVFGKVNGLPPPPPILRMLNPFFALVCPGSQDAGSRLKTRENAQNHVPAAGAVLTFMEHYDRQPSGWGLPGPWTVRLRPGRGACRADAPPEGQPEWGHTRVLALEPYFYIRRSPAPLTGYAMPSTYTAPMASYTMPSAYAAPMASYTMPSSTYHTPSTFMAAPTTFGIPLALHSPYPPLPSYPNKEEAK